MPGMSFDFILKPVGSQCNLDCVYCYYSHTGNSRITHLQWSVDLARKIMTDLAAFESSRGNDKVRVTWHGGEPLMLGLKWYRDVFEFQSTLDVDFANSFQTNGVLLTEEWVEFLKSYDATIGISLDGPAFIHDQQRVTKGKGGTFDRVMRGIDICRKIGAHYGILCVITKSSVNYASEILDFFYDNGIVGFDFLPAYSLSPQSDVLTGISVSPVQFAEFMRTAFDWYLSKDDPDIRIRSITTVIERLLGGRGGVCTIGGQCCGSFLTIEVTGDVAFCDDYNASIFPILGNINDSSMVDIVNSNVFAECRNKAVSRVTESAQCASCTVKEICVGGCPRHWHEDTNYFCEYYKIFYTYAYERLRAVLEPVLANGSETHTSCS